MPVYPMPIRGYQVSITCPGSLDGGEFPRIKRHVARKITEGEPKGQVKFTSKVSGKCVIKWDAKPVAAKQKRRTR